MTKTAIVLFNLGGPDSPEAVEPFLFNLFNDPAIIGAPAPIRWLIARYVSAKRAPVARGIYAHLGGKSPLLEQTEAQAAALQERLGDDFKVLVAMRYWHPFTTEAVAAAKAWGAERVVLLPLYPQYSTTTTASSVREWMRAAKAAGFERPTETVCCYPEEPGLVAAMADLVRTGWAEAAASGRPRVLFSAHGLPQRVVDRGDPYPLHVERTARAVAAATGIADLDWRVCYQSRVGPLKWIGPATEDELDRAGEERVPLVVVPVAFVSEHSETLVELDIEYRHRAEEAGVPAYVRVPALGCHAAFIDSLERLARDPGASRGLACKAAGRICLGGGQG
ncbi:ferrochelatase [Magnetospirillum sp. UT-4]|uniref:ferrochelatase n=1 Tax=Magnetospirillum sp. UT-4 TaxID=2681467 RepID=UPI0013842251|nr:ferrochelatase [Magnetospirillum sp. UT-4]CAA7621948.1 Ferrochelatase [Magnetospirillum sp. UT-4]